jgi:RNA polymerase sporulation-specific sigma factor
MQNLKQPNYIDLNDEKTINKIIVEYEYVIKIYISKFKILSKDYDDAMQEGRIGLLKAIKSYETGKGASFSSFASLCIERQLLSFLRGKNRIKNKILDEYTTIDTVIEYKKYYKSDVEDYIITKIHYEDVYSSSIKKMKGIEKQIFKCYINGFSVSEISEEYQISKRSVYKIISDAKKVIEEKLNNY